MNKGNNLEKNKINFLSKIYKNKEKKEKLKKEKEEIRAWQLKNYGKYYSKPKVIYLSFIGFFLGVAEYKIINLSKSSTTKILKEDENILDDLQNQIIEIKEDVKKESKPARLIINKEKLITINNNIIEVETKYKNIEKDEKIIPINGTLSEKNTKKIDNLKKINEEEIINTNKKINYQKEHFINVSVKKDKKTKTTKDKINKKEREVVLDVLLSMSVDSIVKKIEDEKDILVLEDYIVKLDDYENQTKKVKNIDKIKNTKKIAIKKIELIEESNKKVRTEDDLAEILLMETLVYNQLKKQSKEVKKLKEKIQNLEPVAKQKNIVLKLTNFISKGIKLAFSLFPVVFFKNRKIGLLTSSILINNNIRNMRNSINEVEMPYIEVSKITRGLKKAEDELQYTNTVCYDSKEQLSKLKEECIENLDEYSLDIINEIDKLDKMISSRIEELEKTNKNIKENKEKLNEKVKIKKIEKVTN